jgi:hypothetical protein
MHAVQMSSEMCSDYASYVACRENERLSDRIALQAMNGEHKSPSVPSRTTGQASTSACSSLQTPPASPTHDDDVIPPHLTATQLLSLSIRKRKTLNKRKEKDLTREILVAGTIQRLCVHIGQLRAERKVERRAKKMLRKEEGEDDQSPTVKRARVEKDGSTSPPVIQNPSGMLSFFGDLRSSRDNEMI